MALMLGIDTGGTFTDAVLIDDSGTRFVAGAKAPTTHHDLAIGVGAAVRAVLARVGSDAAGKVALVSVSTTLATNALVEGHGEPAGLFTFGFTENELRRTGIENTIDPGLIRRVDGGHDAHGNPREPLDRAAIEAGVHDLAPRVSAFAVAGQFSVRNPGHEIEASELIHTLAGLPVTSSHELSARLDGPRRALTAALNARLIGTIARLNAAVDAVLAGEQVRAPVMVVRGDGSLVSAAFAARKPIETVLSGPAASVVGALHLAAVQDGLVVDIGGTTTDVAVIRCGRPALAEHGALVGGYRTMVEAVDMATAGIGGDSEVRIDSRDTDDPVVLGPERAIPLCRLALEHPGIHQVLDRQLAMPQAVTGHARFLVATFADAAAGDQRERQLLDLVAHGPVPWTAASLSGPSLRALGRLRSRGLVRIATMTPTDASAVLGSIDGVDHDAAFKAAGLLARQSGPNGTRIASDPETLARRVIEGLVRRSATFVLRSALTADGLSPKAADAELIDAALDRRQGVSAISIGLTHGLTAIGAPAGTYYGAVARRLGTDVIVPDHAELANAIGAVVGRVRVQRSVTVTQPTKGQFRVHRGDQPTFGSVERARDAAEAMVSAEAFAEAEKAGAATPELTTDWLARTTMVEGREVFIEGTLTVEASGRPRL